MQEFVVMWKGKFFLKYYEYYVEYSLTASTEIKSSKLLLIKYMWLTDYHQ